MNEAGERVVRLDTGRVTGAIGVLSNNTRDFLNRIKDVQAQMRRSRSISSSSIEDRSSPAVSTVSTVNTGYKPFM